METLFWQIIGALVAIFLGYLALSDFLDKRRRREQEVTASTSRAQTDLEIKVIELEGKISTQYTELNAKMVNLERAMEERKTTSRDFEDRITLAFEKLESKIEKMQEVVILAVMNKRQPKSRSKG